MVPRLYSFVLQLRPWNGALLDLLDEDDPFDIDEQAAHLFKHVPYGIEDI